jgi:hypothetical protein
MISRRALPALMVLWLSRLSLPSSPTGWVPALPPMERVSVLLWFCELFF